MSKSALRLSGASTTIPRHLKYSSAHQRYTRTTNFLERSFVKEKHCTKAISHHVIERGATKLVFGALIRASRQWNKIRTTDLEQMQLHMLWAVMAPNRIPHIKQSRLP